MHINTTCWVWYHVTEHSGYWSMIWRGHWSSQEWTWGANCCSVISLYSLTPHLKRNKSFPVGKTVSITSWCSPVLTFTTGTQTGNSLYISEFTAISFHCEIWVLCHFSALLSVEKAKKCINVIKEALKWYSAHFIQCLKSPNITKNVPNYNKQTMSVS